jgi:tetratricopeptide (TPR) repeat protein
MVVLVVGLIGVFLLLPRWVSGRQSLAAIAGRPTPLTSPSATPEPEDHDSDRGSQQVVDQTIEAALNEGRVALEAREATRALTAFNRALNLDLGNGAALEGLRRAELLVQVQTLETEAVTRELNGEADAASVTARRALELDPTSQISRGVLDRVARLQADRSYGQLVSQGLAALEKQDFDGALEAFSQASHLRPSAPEVSDGLARARAGIRRVQVAGHLTSASQAEQAEEWSVAVRGYQSALALAPALAAAREGLARSSYRTELFRRLAFHLDNKERLATEAVLEEASALVDEAREVDPRGPKLEALIDRLDTVVRQSSIPIRVILESDGLTEVTLLKVGPLGTFRRRIVELRPGTYTVVGRRPGFRDVRVTFPVPFEASPFVVDLRCTEGI